MLGSAVEDKKQFSINDVEVIEGKNNTENIQKSAFLERPPEFYRTSAEIPIPYRELAARQKIIETAKNGVEILEDITPSVSNYSYTYAAVNTSTNLVLMEPLTGAAGADGVVLEDFGGGAVISAGC